MKKVFIDGQAGTTGLRIFDRLSSLDDIKIYTLNDEERKDTTFRKEMINKSDVTFLCLPDNAAISAVELCENDNTVIIDASTAHRTSSEWSYGFPELSESHRAHIKNSKRIAVPGCHASGFCAIIYPLIAACIMEPNYPIVCHSITGYSGGGKSMIKDYESTTRPNEFKSPAQYALTSKHKHLPEMTTVCKLSCEPIFNPIVADFYSGMAVSVPIFSKLLKKKMTRNELWTFYNDYYGTNGLVRMAPFNENGTESGFIYTNTLTGKDNMEIIISGNDERLEITARFCNLGKGASGAAIQCMNIVFGNDEKKGLVI